MVSELGRRMCVHHTHLPVLITISSTCGVFQFRKIGGQAWIYSIGRTAVIEQQYAVRMLKQAPRTLSFQILV